MKKFFMYSISFLISIMIGIESLEAKTLGDLKNSLKKEEQELKEANKKQALTEQERKNVSNNIEKIKNSIEQTYKDIDNLEAEIAQLNLDIKEKEEQIKEIINFNQISNGDNAYLEYMFGAKDFTDFIYRAAITEQLANYNDKLVDEFNESIKLNEKKKKQIKEKRESLKTKQKDLEKEYDKLGDKIENIQEGKMDNKEQIKYFKEMIHMYEEKGCKDKENIQTCGKNILPSTTSLLRPLKRGYVTSEYSGGWGHNGIDQSVNPKGNVKVYSAGAGVVAMIVERYRCGGNMVYVHHRTTSGKTYTTIYMHLKTINVKKGQMLTRDSIIGTMGGGPDTTSYDKCTFGAHLHFTVIKGLYGVEFHDTWHNHTVNPRNIVNYPKGRYNWFQDRWTAY